MFHSLIGTWLSFNKLVTVTSHSLQHMAIAAGSGLSR